MDAHGLVQTYRILDAWLAAQRSGDADRVSALTEAWQQARQRPFTPPSADPPPPALRR